MGMPSVNVSFTEKATQVIKRGERGIVALILKDSTASIEPFTVFTSADIPTQLTADNKKQIELALMGYVNAPKKVIVYVLAADATDYTDALTYFSTERFDYMAIPTVDTDTKTESMVTWIKAQRDSGRKVKIVLPNTTADAEGVINYATASVTDGTTEYGTADYCSRIAGILAGTPLTIASTYAPLPELTDCTRLVKADMDTAVDSGKLIVFFDGEKVKVARGVNSLTTTTADKGNQFKKIKIVEAMDMIYDDITRVAQDSYLGKFANSYDNKCLLLSAIGGYFEQLILDGILSNASVSVDIDAQRTYLANKGVAVEDLTEDEIRTYDTDDKVFLKASIKILDAIEEITMPISI